MERFNVGCSKGNDSERVCTNENCKASAIMCCKRDCQCHVDHEHCYTSALINNIVSDLFKKNQTGSVYFGEVINYCDTLIKTIEIYKSDVKRLIDDKKTFLEKDEKSFMKLLETHSQSQITGNLLSKVIKSINYRTEKNPLEELKKNIQSVQPQVSKQIQRINYLLRQLITHQLQQNERRNISDKEDLMRSTYEIKKITERINERPTEEFQRIHDSIYEMPQEAETLVSVGRKEEDSQTLPSKQQMIPEALRVHCKMQQILQVFHEATKELDFRAVQQPSIPGQNQQCSEKELEQTNLEIPSVKPYSISIEPQDGEQQKEQAQIQPQAPRNSLQVSVALLDTLLDIPEVSSIPAHAQEAVDAEPEGAQNEVGMAQSVDAMFEALTEVQEKEQNIPSTTNNSGETPLITSQTMEAEVPTQTTGDMATTQHKPMTQAVADGPTWLSDQSILQTQLEIPVADPYKESEARGEAHQEQLASYMQQSELNVPQVAAISYGVEPQVEQNPPLTTQDTIAEPTSQNTPAVPTNTSEPLPQANLQQELPPLTPPE